MEEFLPQAGKKLGLKNARYAYLATGTEVTSAMLLELEDDTEVYISEREGFYRSGAIRLCCKRSVQLIVPAAGKPGNFKVALLGVGGVGKSCISLKYIKGAFTDQYDPSIEVRDIAFFVCCSGPVSVSQSHAFGAAGRLSASRDMRWRSMHSGGVGHGRAGAFGVAGDASS